MKNGKLGYGVLGLGIGMAHADAAHASENAELVAVCDIDAGRLDDLHRKYPEVTLYRDAKALFADPAVDIISICLPSGMHGDYAVRAMDAGKHVLIEKPIELSPERAQCILDACARTQKKASVVFQNRFNFDMNPIRDAVKSGRLGNIALATFAVKWYRAQKYYENGWHGTWSMDGGGSLMNQAVHTVDLMRWLLGKPVSVSAQYSITGHEIETEDTTAAVVRFESGTIATMVSTTCAYPGISTEIGLYGTEGSIEADGDVLRLWKLRAQDDDSDDEEEEEDEMLHRFGQGNRGCADPHRLFGHPHVVEDMICAVRDDRDPEVTPADAIESVRLVCAIYRAAQTGETIRL